MSTRQKNISTLLIIFTSSIVLAGNSSEVLLKNFHPIRAVKAYDLLNNCKQRKDFTPNAMTDVARAIFFMYGLNPKDITASYGGTSSKAVIEKNSGRIRISISERRDIKLEHYAKAYGNDTFMHEMLHALGFKWKANGAVKFHGLSHSNNEEKVYFEKCRKILVGIFQELEAKDKLFKQKFEKLLIDDKQFYEDEQLLIKNYIKYRSRTVRIYSQAKKLHPLDAIEYVHNLGLPFDAEYVNGHFNGKEMLVVKIHIGSGTKKYKPDMEKLYYDDIIRAIDKQIKIIYDELKTVRKGEYPKEKMIIFLNIVRFEKFKRQYWYRFIKKQNIEMKLTKL